MGAYSLVGELKTVILTCTRSVIAKMQITGKPTAEGLDLSRESRKATPKGDAYEPTL